MVLIVLSERGFRMAEFRFTEQQWDFVKFYIPKQETGRPRSRDRECLEAIFYVLMTGMQWVLLPSCYPPKSTVHRRFMLFRKKGFFRRLFKATRTKEVLPGLIHLDATIKVVKRGTSGRASRQVQKQQNSGRLHQWQAA